MMLATSIPKKLKPPTSEQVAQKKRKIEDGLTAAKTSNFPSVSSFARSGTTAAAAFQGGKHAATNKKPRLEEGFLCDRGGGGAEDALKNKLLSAPRSRPLPEHLRSAVQPPATNSSFEPWAPRIPAASIVIAASPKKIAPAPSLQKSVGSVRVPSLKHTSLKPATTTNNRGSNAGGQNKIAVPPQRAPSHTHTMLSPMMPPLQRAASQQSATMLSPPPPKVKNVGIPLGGKSTDTSAGMMGAGGDSRQSSSATILKKSVVVRSIGNVVQPQTSLGHLRNLLKQPLPDRRQAALSLAAQPKLDHKAIPKKASPTKKAKQTSTGSNSIPIKGKNGMVMMGGINTKVVAAKAVTVGSQGSVSSGGKIGPPGRIVGGVLQPPAARMIRAGGRGGSSMIMMRGGRGAGGTGGSIHHPSMASSYLDQVTPEDLDFIDDEEEPSQNTQQWKTVLREVTGYDPRKFAVMESRNPNLSEALVSDCRRVQMEELLSAEKARREDQEELKKILQEDEDDEDDEDEENEEDD